MHRLLFLTTLALFTLPAFAWEAGVDGPLCTLEHAGDAADVRLTYDPALPEYTISIRRSEPWPLAPIFALSFEGGRANLIQTTRHMLSADRRTLSVADRGFGNVLDGLEFNEVARVLTGETDVAINLDGAALEVAAFRACVTAPTV